MTNKQKGIMFILLSAFSFSIMNVFVKLAVDIPTMQKCFFRNLLSIAISLYFLHKNHVPIKWEKGNFKLLLARAALGTTGTLTNYYAVSHILLSDATMLNKLATFFAILFSFLCLKEKITLRQIGYLVLAFIGSLFIIKPGFNFENTIPALSGLVCGISAGGSYVAVRALGLKGVNSHYTVFFFSVFSCLVTLPSLIFSFTSISRIEFFYLAMISIFGAGGQYGITAAYYHAPAREISLYDYSIVIFSSIWSYFLWDALPDYLSVIGYVTILIAAISMFRYNNQNFNDE